MQAVAVPFLSLAVVLGALASMRRGLTWRLVCLAAALPPLALTVLLLADPAAGGSLGAAMLSPAMFASPVVAAVLSVLVATGKGPA